MHGHLCRHKGGGKEEWITRDGSQERDCKAVYFSHRIWSCKILQEISLKSGPPLSIRNYIYTWFKPCHLGTLFPAIYFGLDNVNTSGSPHNCSRTCEDKCGSRFFATKLQPQDPETQTVEEHNLRSPPRNEHICLRTLSLFLRDLVLATVADRIYG